MTKRSSGIAFFFFIALVFSPCLFSQSVTARADFEKIVKDMDVLFRKSKSVQEPRNKEIFRFVEDKLKKKEIAVAFKKGGSLYESILFSPAGTPTLTIDEQALKNHKQGFSLTMSLLIYNFNRIYVYFANPKDFDEMMKTKLTQHMIDIDCYYLMGMFVNEYIVPAGFKVTLFEDFIRDRITNNDFDSVAGALLLENMPVMNSIFQLYREHESVAELDAGLVKLFQEECESLLVELLKDDIGEYERFFKLIILRSFFMDGLDAVFLATGKKYDVNTIRDFGGASGRFISACGVFVQINAEFIDQTSRKMRVRIGLPQ